MHVHERRLPPEPTLPRWPVGAAGALIALAFLYCYGYALLAGTPASALQSFGWALADWGVWLAGAPFLAQRAAAWQRRSPPWPELARRCVRDIAVVVLLALALRAAVAVAVGEAELGFLLFKRFPVYLALGAAIAGAAAWRARPPRVQLVTAPAADAEPRLAVQSARGEHLLGVSEIDCIEACGNYLEVRARGATYLMRCTMKALEGQLQGTRLARCHRSFFVNLDRIGKIELRDSGNHALQLEGGAEVPLSKAYRDAVRAALRPG